MRRIRTEIIAAGHPALPGHFPGNPVVPGVLILARVLAAVRAELGVDVAAVPIAKFHARLRPDERFEIKFDDHRDAVRFEVSRGSTLIASGLVRAAPAATH